ncbi:hypothetical protein NZD85_13485 [Empedobacter stercoris]|uniref:DUF3592 domain-containing protein n=2 Tax=Empedobacter TaxID=59734 RepID=A0ABY8V636_9FLAO|nr:MULTISPECIES: hypothetical protein [Empedobacter]MCA4776955.1 hypothetical protein [Empedobacter stercoris]MCA4809477.1 hypothetical protein [Empedobacter stercoris]MDM1524118.1 hypothetical protein [Empedobacter sp. 225-1]MDM1544047.1 hypothetical protein [Empedobacter sp. 189-2]NOJ75091.1 hypothetical protein [Empedobacter stercoris]
MNKFLPSLKNEKEDKKTEFLKWLGIILILIFLSGIIFFNQRNSLNEIKEKRLYTVGIISGFSKTRSMEFVKYIYSYNGHSYEGKAPKDISKFSVGEKVLVVYNPDTHIKYLVPYIIDDSIKEPMNGWEKPPMNITDEEVMKYLEDKY